MEPQMHPNWRCSEPTQTLPKTAQDRSNRLCPLRPCQKRSEPKIRSVPLTLRAHSGPPWKHQTSHQHLQHKQQHSGNLRDNATHGTHTHMSDCRWQWRNTTTCLHPDGWMYQDVLSLAPLISDHGEIIWINCSLVATEHVAQM